MIGQNAYNTITIFSLQATRMAKQQVFDDTKR
jgi:hypothetical protein